jgi:hypothetical protein
MQVEVPLETGTSEGSGGVRNDDGTHSRGYKVATLRTLLDHAGLITQVGLCPIHVHALPACRLLCETAPVLRTGDLLVEDRGFLDGATITLLKEQRHVDVIVPLKATRLSYKDAVQLAVLADAWQPHPSRAHQHIALVKGVEHLWDACPVPLNAGVLC